MLLILSGVIYYLLTSPKFKSPGYSKSECGTDDDCPEGFTCECTRWHSSCLTCEDVICNYECVNKSENSEYWNP